MKVLAPAKINIYLKVLGERPDGYHELKTIMVPLNVFDEIYINPAVRGIKLEAPGYAGDKKDNLAFRAAKLFFDETGLKRGVSIKLIKHIPSGAGLGGGSSDAACVLTTMNDMFKTRLGEKRLLSMAGKLGADCPFFVLKQPLIMGARGDIPLKRIELEDRAYLLVTPPFGIPTASVYANIKKTPHHKKDILNIDNIWKLAPEDWLINDLEDVVFPMSPQVARIKQELLASGAAGALMSGSGSTVFGVFNDDAHLLNAMNNLKKHTGYQYISTTEFIDS